MSTAGIMFCHTEFNQDYLTHFWHLITSEGAHVKECTWLSILSY